MRHPSQYIAGLGQNSYNCAVMVSRKSSRIAIWLCWVLIIQLINLALDTPDMGGRYLEERLDLNDRESLVEWLLEDLCGKENAIPETDEHDYDKCKKSFDYYFAPAIQTNRLSTEYHRTTLPEWMFATRLIDLFAHQINSPPPEHPRWA